MTEMNATIYYQRFRNILLFRLFVTTAVILFWTIKTMISSMYSEDKSFFLVFLISSHLMIIIALIFGFTYANKRKATYKSGDFKTRFENYTKATMYRFSVLEFSPVLLMAGFAMFGKFFFIAEAIAIYIVLALNFPTKKRLSKRIDFLIE